MNKKELDEELENQIPDADDEQFWDDFNRELWFMFKKAEDFSDVEMDSQIFEDVSESVERAVNSREKCLSFERCAEIGQKNAKISDAERLHLQDCRFCPRRIEKFGELPQIATIENESDENLPKKSFWSGILSQADSFFNQISGKLVFASLATIAIFGMAIIFILTSDKSDQETVSITDPTKNAPLPEISNPPTNEILETDSNNQTSINSPVNNSRILPDKTKEITPKSNSADKKPSDNEIIELAFLSGNERQAVRESVQVGRIQISKDLALLQENPILRGNEKIAVPQISPKDEATLENRPVLRWENLENYEYKIIILDQGLKKVAESGVLSQNSWQTEKPIPADFYFWKVLARKKGAAEFEQTENKAFFKIVGEPEKSRIEKAKKLTKSNLVTAVLYARAGLLREAERELNAELQKYPNSVKAKKMLEQVRQWRKK
jgi:hypothetical protein